MAGGAWDDDRFAWLGTERGSGLVGNEARSFLLLVVSVSQAIKPIYLARQAGRGLMRL